MVEDTDARPGSLGHDDGHGTRVVSPDRRTEPAPEQLTLYLRDHRAGAAGGERLARRCRDRSAPEHRTELAAIADEIAGERATLDELLATLDVGRPRIKEAVVFVGELVARLKLNRRLVQRAPASSVLEIEMLISAVSAKRQLWCSLAALPAPIQPSQRQLWLDLVARADVQLTRLRALHTGISSSAFACGATTTTN